MNYLFLVFAMEIPVKSTMKGQLTSFYCYGFDFSEYSFRQSFSTTKYLVRCIANAFGKWCLSTSYINSVDISLRYFIACFGVSLWFNLVELPNFVLSSTFSTNFPLSFYQVKLYFVIFNGKFCFLFEIGCILVIWAKMSYNV